MRRTLLFSSTAIAFGVLATTSSIASPMYDTTRSTCTTRDCNSVLIGGTVLSFAGEVSYAGAWVGQIRSEVGDCLRLRVIGQTFDDLEMLVVAPNGTVWRNDDGGIAPCPTCPLVKINNAPVRGWYTVSIAQKDGGAIDDDFQLRFGSYNLDNPNCTPPTPPLGP